MPAYRHMPEKVLKSCSHFGQNLSAVQDIESALAGINIAWAMASIRAVWHSP